MRESPEPVLLYIPLMKDLNFTWSEIKDTPHIELEALLFALGEYNKLHSMDGYNDKDVNQMAKERPEVRSHYSTYLETKRKYYGASQKKVMSFRQALNQ
jgi:hypothetical protein